MQNKLIKEKISNLTSTLQALTLQKMNALRVGNRKEADAIQSVQVDIDNRIVQLERAIRLIKS
tara:strand:- start:353 stop:541 length:189 start_codon:yes stop_codon:yes gene_type:complete